MMHSLLLSYVNIPGNVHIFSGLMSHHVLTVLRIIYTPEPKKHFKKLISIGFIKIDVMSYYN